MKKETIAIQSIREEIANAITHGVGIILSIIAIVVLLYNAIGIGSIRHIISFSLYGSALLILYTISTLYHSITHISAKKVLRRLDHISIYLLIAGTYMPLTLVILKGALGWTLFGMECGLCLMGVVFKAIFGTRLGFLSALFYILMGWLAIFAIKPISIAISINGFIWILLGGIFYTLGILFFATDKKFSYFHTIWHIFVLAGSICHFFMVLLYIMPFVR